MFIGHKKITSFFERAISRDALAHAHIFSGPVGLGKFTLALELGKKLAGNINEINPDLIVIKPQIEETKKTVKKKDIKVENIRDLQQFLSTTGGVGNKKIAIIDEADRLTVSAQNALLKTLEEPPDQVVVFLIVENEKRLLPTIRSRCQMKRFNPVTDAELDPMIPEQNKNRKELLFWSLGRPGLLVRMLNDDSELDKRKQSLVEFDSMIQNNLAERFEVAEKMSKDTRETPERLELWMVILRQQLLSGVGRAVSLDLIEKIDKSRETIKNTNSNARLVLENLFLSF